MTEHSQLNHANLEDVWEAFNFQNVVGMLLSESTGFFGQRSIYLATLGAWIAAPSDIELRRIAISQAMLNLCIDVEQSGYEIAKGGKSEKLVFTEAFCRIGKPDVVTFYKEIYHPRRAFDYSWQVCVRRSNR